jgi:predicted metal-dependent hydrolase
MPAPSPFRQTLIAAAREFNSGRYFEAHEVLEDGLDEVPAPFWDLALGLIQIAVGYHKASQGLRAGAAAMLGRGLDKTKALPDDAAGLNLAALRQRVAADIAALGGGASGPELLRTAPPRIRFA